MSIEDDLNRSVKASESCANALESIATSLKVMNASLAVIARHIAGDLPAEGVETAPPKEEKPKRQRKPKKTPPVPETVEPAPTPVPEVIAKYADIDWTVPTTVDELKALTMALAPKLDQVKMATWGRMVREYFKTANVSDLPEDDYEEFTNLLRELATSDHEQFVAKLNGMIEARS